MASITDYARMCKAHDDCRECPLHDIPHPCDEYLVHFPTEASAIIDKWCAEHPQKTYLKDFLGKFPDAKMSYDTIPNICRAHVYGGHCPLDNDNFSCADCWNEVMPEDAGNE